VDVGRGEARVAQRRRDGLFERARRSVDERALAFGGREGRAVAHDLREYGGGAGAPAPQAFERDERGAFADARALRRLDPPAGHPRTSASLMAAAPPTRSASARPCPRSTSAQATASRAPQFPSLTQTFTARRSSQMLTYPAALFDTVKGKRDGLMYRASSSRATRSSSVMASSDP